MGDVSSRVRLNVDLPRDLHRAVKARAGAEGCTVQELVERLVATGMTRIGGGEGRR
jgi:predicted DNA binding CopG/RHH family protein